MKQCCNDVTYQLEVWPGNGKNCARNLSQLLAGNKSHQKLNASPTFYAQTPPITPLNGGSTPPPSTNTHNNRPVYDTIDY